MDVKKNTENYLALADDVIASITTTCPVSQVEPYLSFEVPGSSLVRRSEIDKSFQTDINKMNKSIQHDISNVNIALQNTPLNTHHSTQTEFGGSSLATQTEPDISYENIKELFKNTTNIFTTKFTQIDKLWKVMQERFIKCSSEIQRLSTLLTSLLNSRDDLKINLKKIEFSIKVNSLIHFEMESRTIIREDEEVKRYNTTLTAYKNMIVFHREIDSAFKVAQNQLFEKLDYINNLEEQLCDNNEVKSTDTEGSYVIPSGSVSTEIIDDNESVKEMKQLLTECWVLLGQDT